MQDFVNMVVNNGVAIAVVIYFFYKDSTLTKENTEILNQIKSLLDTLIENNKKE